MVGSVGAARLATVNFAVSTVGHAGGSDGGGEGGGGEGGGDGGGGEGGGDGGGNGEGLDMDFPRDRRHGPFDC